METDFPVSISNNQTIFTRRLSKTSPLTIKLRCDFFFSSNRTLRVVYLFCNKCTQAYKIGEEPDPASPPKTPEFVNSFSLCRVALSIHFSHIIDYFLLLQVNEATVEQLVQQYPHITFSTVLQDCKRTLERAYQMGWTPNMSTAS